MNRAIVLILIFLSLSSIGDAQENKLPRDINKLFLRVQEFWKFLGTDKVKALDYVLPEKRALMIGNPRLPYKNPQIAGLDLTPDPNRAKVRISLDVMASDISYGYWHSEMADQWVWTKNNWFLDLPDKPTKAMFKADPGANATVIESIKADLDKNFVVAETVIDLGKIPHGDRRVFSIHFQYAGSNPAELQVGFPTEAILNDRGLRQLTNTTKELPLTLLSEFVDGDFVIPVTLKALVEGVFVERRVVVRGSAAAPLTFAQFPDLYEDSPTGKFAIRIRNNTSEAMRVIAVATDDAFSISDLPLALPANGEGTINLNRKATGPKPDKVYITIDPPTNGRSQFVYPIRVRPQY